MPARFHAIMMSQLALMDTYAPAALWGVFTAHPQRRKKGDGNGVDGRARRAAQEVSRRGV
jgi:hypothetical protein